MRPLLVHEIKMVIYRYLYFSGLLRVVKIFIVGIVGVPAAYGGFETLVDQLLDQWNGRSGISITVFCSDRPAHGKQKYYRGAKLVYLPVPANGAWSIIYDALGLLIAVTSRADSVLVLGVSGAIFLPIVRLLSPAKIVVNLDGNEAGRAKWGGFASLFLKLSTWMARKFSTHVIVDNQALYNEIGDSRTLRKIRVIAYGGNHALDGEPKLAGSEILSVTAEMHEYGLCISRIVPENNILLILEAVTQMKVPFVIVGNWCASSYGRDLRAQYQANSQLRLLDPVYDKDDLYSLRVSASFYIHGASAGGTNPSLVEMMFFPLPIFIYDCSYNRETTCNAGYFYRNGSELMGLIAEKKEGKLKCDDGLLDIARRRYNWSVIGEQYFDLLT
jgi:glycosyltransferase involved in cell wall biosynthesis